MPISIDTSIEPKDMTPQARIEIINESRRRMMREGELSDVELKYAIKLMTEERKLSSAKTGAAKAKKAEPKPLDFSDF